MADRRFHPKRDTRAQVTALVRRYPHATHEEIATALGVTRQRIGQILKGVKRKPRPVIPRATVAVPPPQE